jgi:hypothetical protein
MATVVAGVPATLGVALEALEVVAPSLVELASLPPPHPTRAAVKARTARLWPRIPNFRLVRIVKSPRYQVETLESFRRLGMREAK